MRGFPSLPEELQLGILEQCDSDTLAAICRTSRANYARALPLLWSDIDFRWTDDHEGPQLRFLQSCDRCSRGDGDGDGETFERLAAIVQSLNFTTIPGINVPSEGAASAIGDFTDWPQPGVRTRNVYDIVALFPNLQRLALYVKEFDDDSSVDGPLARSVRSLTAVLPTLQDVTVGGQIPASILQALLARPEQIERLSLINLTEMPGQSDGPLSVTFLEPLQHRFTSLTYLHLAKIAELYDAETEPDSWSWQWDVDNERELLAEWAGLLEHVHGTLRELVVENHYFDRYTNRQQPHSSQHEERNAFLWTLGKGSSKRCKEILFPVFGRHDWPSLRQVTLGGIYVDGEDGGASSNPFALMGEQVTLDIRPGSILETTYDVTPMEIEPPKGTFDYFSVEH